MGYAKVILVQLYPLLAPSNRYFIRMTVYFSTAVSQGSVAKIISPWKGKRALVESPTFYCRTVWRFASVM